MCNSPTTGSGRDLSFDSCDYAWESAVCMRPSQVTRVFIRWYKPKKPPPTCKLSDTRQESGRAGKSAADLGLEPCRDCILSLGDISSAVSIKSRMGRGETIEMQLGSAIVAA